VKTIACRLFTTNASIVLCQQASTREGAAVRKPLKILCRISENKCKEWITRKVGLHNCRRSIFLYFKFCCQLLHCFTFFLSFYIKIEDCFIGKRTGNKCHLKRYSQKLGLQALTRFTAEEMDRWNGGLRLMLRVKIYLLYSLIFICFHHYCCWVVLLQWGTFTTEKT